MFSGLKSCLRTWKPFGLTGELALVDSHEPRKRILSSDKVSKQHSWTILQIENFRIVMKSYQGYNNFYVLPEPFLMKIDNGF